MKPTEPGRNGPRAGEAKKQWTFLNNHAHVLLCLARKPEAVLREVAQQVGITERATQTIVRDLVEYGVLLRQRDGRCNTYRIDRSKPLRHVLEKEHTVGDLLEIFLP